MNPPSQKDRLKKKFRRRLAIVTAVFTLVALGGGYFFWPYFSNLVPQAEEAGAPEAASPDSVHGPLLPVENPRPMDQYAHPFTPASPEQAMISLVLLGVGQFPDLTEQALDKLPPDITFALSPLVPHAKEWAQKAHEKQHDVMVTVGLQPDSYPSNDPGPNTLLVSLSGEENVKRLTWALEQVPLAVGVTHDMGNHFTTVDASLRPIIREVRRAGLFFLDTLLSPDSLVSKISREEQSPCAVVYYFCSENPLMVGKDLRNLEILAKQKGHVIAVALLTPVFLQNVLAWLENLKGKNIALLPLTALFKLNILKDPTRLDAEKS